VGVAAREDRETPKAARPRRARRRWLLLALVLVVAAVAVVVVVIPAPKAHPLRVGSVTEAGTLDQPEEWFRDGGQSAPVGQRILWMFGDTLFPKAAPDGSHLRSNTAAWSDRSDALQLSHPVDADGLPVQFLPFDQLETAYNELSGKPDDRVAVWPTSAIATSDGSATVFFREVMVAPGALNLEVLGSGVATVSAGAETAVRDPNLLFHAPGPVFSSGAIEVDGMVDLFGCTRMAEQRFGCRLARAPTGDLDERSAYEFWNGTEWTDDDGDAAFVLEGPSGGPSISWNPWLDRYLAVYTLGLSNRVMMRTAEQLEGPWSEPVEAFVGAPTEGGAVNYAAFEHPELSTDGGRTITITYFHPLGEFRGEFRIVKVRFA
jgi:hypothetical protein